MTTMMPSTPRKLVSHPLRHYQRLKRAQYVSAGYGMVQHAIIVLLQTAPRLNLFTSRTNPVWSGWVTAASMAWHLPPEFSEAPFEFADPEERFQDIGQHLGEIMLDMAERRLLEKRLCRPYRFNPSPDIASFQDWEFRLPGDAGCCYWEPDQPFQLRSDDEWPDLVNARHRAMLLAALEETDSQVPPYVLARIERRYQLQAKRRRVLLY